MRLYLIIPEEKSKSRKIKEPKIQRCMMKSCPSIIFNRRMRIFNCNAVTMKLWILDCSENIRNATPSLSKLHNFGKRFDTPPLSLKRSLEEMHKNILAQREHDVRAKL